jgi:hypothetical protein
LRLHPPHEPPAQPTGDSGRNAPEPEDEPYPVRLAVPSATQWAARVAFGGSGKFGRFEEIEEDGGEEGDDKLGKDDKEVVDTENCSSVGSSVAVWNRKGEGRFEGGVRGSCWRWGSGAGRACAWGRRGKVKMSKWGVEWWWWCMRRWWWMARLSEKWVGFGLSLFVPFLSVALLIFE